MVNNVSPQNAALVGLLGRLDALFWPRRGDFDQSGAEVRAGLRRDWRHQGLPVRTRGAGANERKSQESLWLHLESDGLVTIAAAGGRRTHVRYTLAGEMRARCLCATGNVVDGWDFFASLVGLFGTSAGKSLPGSHAGGNLLSEAFTAGCTPWRRTRTQREELTRQMISLLPFLTAGWITASGDAGGRYWLNMTDEGRDAHRAGCPVDPAPDVQLDEGASTLYERTFAEYTTELDSMKPRSGAPVVIPVAVGLNWGGYGDAHD
ncbi:MAG TPA: hypothetical protein VMY37_09945 [Thermoguttaceae bacterium]|nr:hypothetical protein [Thermoguttaceae bacterium]